jgi:hypothetical protein
MKQKPSKPCKCGGKRLSRGVRCYKCHLVHQRELKVASDARSKERKSAKKARHEQTKSYRKVLMDKAWTLMSLYIRQGAADQNGMVKCYTCGTSKHYKEMHAGHLWHSKLDFDPRNIHPQCYSCNVGHSGRREVYSANLLAEGIDLIKLRRDAEIKLNQYTTMELDVIIWDLKIKLKNLTNEKGT